MDWVPIGVQLPSDHVSPAGPISPDRVLCVLGVAGVVKPDPFSAGAGRGPEVAPRPLAGKKRAPVGAHALKS